MQVNRFCSAPNAEIGRVARGRANSKCQDISRVITGPFKHFDSQALVSLKYLEYLLQHNWKITYLGILLFNSGLSTNFSTHLQ